MTLSNTLKKQKSIAQIIPNRLYFGSFDTPPTSDNNIVYLNINESVHYDAFYYDFGPLNLAVLYRFCESLQEILLVIIIIIAPNFFPKKCFFFNCLNFSQKKNVKFLYLQIMIQIIA